LEKGTGSLTGGKNDDGEGLPSVVVGPVQGDRVLGMARLTRDYSPLHLFSGDVNGKGVVTTLHPMWISGSVGVAVQMIARSRRVTGLSLKHLGTSRMGDTLFVSASVGKTTGRDIEIVVRIKVSNQNSKVVALGEARVTV